MFLISFVVFSQNVSGESVFGIQLCLTGSVILEFMQAATELFGKHCLLQFEEPSWDVDL